LAHRLRPAGRGRHQVPALRPADPHHLAGPDRYDWSFADETFAELQRRDIVPIVDLCHFGVPDWMGNFQNSDLPHLFERYARAFAERFPGCSSTHR
jgi:beta-glucosidase/6-phospho-beta-glucosidase/beta-galactosidase